MIRTTLTLAGLLATIAAFSGCSAQIVTVGGGCTSGGQVHQAGDRFPAPDGCNTCTCQADGTVACTELGCVATCEVDGATYPVGANVPGGGDGCNVCTCVAANTVTCMHEDCPDEGCAYQGMLYPPGSSWPAGDGCNTCECEPGGIVSCTAVWCAQCVYGGTSYPPGASYPSLDGCNTCTCQPDGTSSCTKVACACDPTGEWWRKYVSESPSECMVIDYSCPINTTAFSNDCGCGCEEAASCPQSFDCMPPKMCDVAALMAECPYSVIAL